MQKFKSPAVFLALVSLLLIAACDSQSDPVVIPTPRDVAKADYTTLPSGLKIYDFTAGEGVLAEKGSTVQVHYALWLENNVLIESSLLTGRPIAVNLGTGEVIAGWDEGLVGMREGGDRQLVIPPALAYGAEGIPSSGIPPNATLVFEVVLIAVAVPDGI